VLPDGAVLLFGGVDSQGQVVDTAEVFAPETQTFTLVSSSGLTPRTDHTATLLSDGTVLLVGGRSATGEPLVTAEVWAPQTQTVTVIGYGSWKVEGVDGRHFWSR
jgi:hypothetical protein